MTAISTTNEDDRALVAMPPVEPLAKKTAHSTLYRRLVEEGLDEAAAEVVSRAVVDPADARRRLDRLVEVRVPGGRFFALDTQVWAPALTSYAVNNREASARHFPAGGAHGQTEASRFRPLRPPTDPSDESARLRLRAESPEHLVWSLERSAKFLSDHNPLAESIAAQGVMVAVTAVVIECEFYDGSDPVTMLATADGSSRATGAHQVLSLKPREVVFDLPANERVYRGMISELLAALERPATAVSEDEVRRLHALEVPTRLLLRFEPDEVAPVGFSRAVESLVHLVHVEPPKAWDEAASLDAKADSVVTALHDARVVTRTKRDYLDGMLTPEEARDRGLPGEADERALWIVKTLSDEKPATRRAVRAGVLELAHAQKQVRREEKARIAVELALRSVRADSPPAYVKSARGTLQSAYLMPALWAAGVTSDADASPEALRDAALGELDAGAPGQACARLAGQGAFWLAVHRVLREAHFFGDKEHRDGRSPQRLLEKMMTKRWGVLVLYRAIVDGREGQPPAQIDENGRREKAVTGQLLFMSSEWLRRTVVPLADKSGSDGSKGDHELPTRMLMQRVARFRDGVGTLEDLHNDLRGVEEASGAKLIDLEGMNPQIVDDLRQRLDNLRTKLAMYGERWKETNTGEDDVPDYEAELDEDELDEAEPISVGSEA